MGGGHIPARTVVWAAGVKASPAARWLGVEADRAGRVPVTGQLTLPDEPRVFIVGDTAAAVWREGSFVPGIAPAAKQMGAYAARTILADLKGRAISPFHYRHQGNLATVGRQSAIVDFGRVRMKGFIAWLVWGAAHIYFLIGFRNRLIVMLHWIWAYVTLRQGVRLITGSTELPE